MSCSQVPRAKRTWNIHVKGKHDLIVHRYKQHLMVASTCMLDALKLLFQQLYYEEVICYQL